MLNDIINIAKEFLNDNDLKILRYAETNQYYLFEYGTKDGKPLFDNTLIKVDKETKRASNYIITEHLKEMDKLIFKDAK